MLCFYPPANIRPVRSKKEKLQLLCVVILCIAGVTCCARYSSSIASVYYKCLYLCFLNFLNGCIAWCAIRMTDMPVIFHFRSGRQYLTAVCISVILTAIFALFPLLCGFRLVGGHVAFRLSHVCFYLYFYLLLVGPVEELLFRVYLQDTICSLLPAHKWTGVVITAVLFGLWHIINGSLLQAVFTASMGCVLGFSKYAIRHYHFPGLALSHGLYDFLNYLIRICIQD